MLSFYYIWSTTWFHRAKGDGTHLRTLISKSNFVASSTKPLSAGLWRCLVDLAISRKKPIGRGYRAGQHKFKLNGGDIASCFLQSSLLPSNRAGNTNFGFELPDEHNLRIYDLYTDFRFYVNQILIFLVLQFDKMPCLNLSVCLSVCLSAEQRAEKTRRNQVFLFFFFYQLRVVLKLDK